MCWCWQKCSLGSFLRITGTALSFTASRTGQYVYLPWPWPETRHQLCTPGRQTDARLDVQHLNMDTPCLTKPTPSCLTWVLPLSPPKWHLGAWTAWDRRLQQALQGSLPLQLSWIQSSKAMVNSKVLWTIVDSLSWVVNKDGWFSSRWSPTLCLDCNVNLWVILSKTYPGPRWQETCRSQWLVW
jgi:hypothetical protein